MSKFLIAVLFVFGAIQAMASDDIRPADDIRAVFDIREPTKDEGRRCSYKWACYPRQCPCHSPIDPLAVADVEPVAADCGEEPIGQE